MRRTKFRSALNPALYLAFVINRRSKSSVAAFETLPSGTGLSARQKNSPGEKSGFISSRFVKDKSWFYVFVRLFITVEAKYSAGLR